MLMHELEAQSAAVLPSRETMARFISLNVFVYAPSAAVVVINRSSYNNAVAIAGASISITQTATG
jgi:hypothetical protein